MNSTVSLLVKTAKKDYTRGKSQLTTIVIDLFTNITRVFAYVCLNMKYKKSLCNKSRRL